MPQLVIEGTVFSGKRESKRFLELPWVRRQIQQKLGFTPYPGTLNLRLPKRETEKRKQLPSIKEIIIEPKPGYCPGGLLKASINDLSCAVIFPHIPKYPDNVLEIISTIYLRGKLDLTDGSLVSVIVTF